MSQAITAVVSLLLGIAITELVRRSNRIETYAAAVFQKRLAVYERLFLKLHGAKEIADQILEDESLTNDERHGAVSAIVLDIARFCDENDFYLNDEVAIHCCSVFMGVEDIQPDTPQKKKERFALQLAARYRDAQRIIKAESGMKRMDEIFHSAADAKYSTDMIDYYRELKKKQRQHKS